MNYYHLISRTSLRLLHSASQFDEKEEDEVVLVVEEVEDELFAEIFSSSCRWSASLSFLPAWEMVRLINSKRTSGLIETPVNILSPFLLLVSANSA